MFILAYIYLSNCIKLTPRQSYDSLRSRAILLNENMSYTTIMLIKYCGIGVLPDPFYISDYYFASLGFNYNPSMQAKCLSTAKKLHQSLEDITISGRDANDYSIIEISELVEKRHEQLYENLLLDFKLNKFIPKI